MCSLSQHPPSRGGTPVIPQTSMGLTGKSQLHSKLGLRGEHAGNVTVGTDKRNGMCGHNGGGYRIVLSQGRGPL